MTATYVNADGLLVYLHPAPPPPPQPTISGTSASGLNGALSTAAHDDTVYWNSGSDGDKQTAENDWGQVEGIILNQYRIALNSSDSAKEVAALDKQFGNYYQDHGDDTSVYNEVVADAKNQAQKESPDLRAAQIQLDGAFDESDDTPTKGLDIVSAAINVQLQTLFGDGNGGVYTSDQFNAAAAAVAKAFGNKDTSLIDTVAASMAGGSEGEGGTVGAILSVLQTENFGLTPGEINAKAIGGMPLTPAEVSSGTLILGPGEAQLDSVDPGTLAFLMADGIAPQQPLSKEMVRLASEDPRLFAYMQLNGVNISTSAVPSVAINSSSGPLQFKLNDDGCTATVLNITLHGAPVTANQLPADWPQALDISKMVAAFQNAGSSDPRAGSENVAANLLAQLPLNPKTFSTPAAQSSDPAGLQLQTLASLMQSADATRGQYLDGQIADILEAAPDATDAHAAAYIGDHNSDITTSLNGFFFDDSRQGFWSNDAAALQLQNYLRNGLGSWFQSGKPNALILSGNYVLQALSGASPEVASTLVNTVESYGTNYKSQADNEFDHIGDARLLSGLSKAVQIVDPPAEAITPQTQVGPEAAQVAGWLDSQSGAQFLNGSATALYDETSKFGDFDLANALTRAFDTVGGTQYLTKDNVNLGGDVSQEILDGEQRFDDSLQRTLGSNDYAAFDVNKARTLAIFHNQFSNASNIDTPISVLNVDAQRQGIITANGWDPNNLTDSQAAIIKLDLAWIDSQSAPGSTVTIVPFLFTSSGSGVSLGVFFDVENPDPLNPSKHTQVLIDGSAAREALAEDPNANNHPTQIDIDWHYSSYRDFQLHNQLYLGGTIFAMPGNSLGLDPNGVASSDSDFHTDFDGVMNVVANEGVMIAGIALAPVTDGASLGIAGSISMAWDSWAGYERYRDFGDHGERFSWSNPNARSEIIGDGMLALGYLTMATGITEGAFKGVAEGLGKAAGLEFNLRRIQQSVGMAVDAEYTPSSLSESLNTLGQTYHYIGQGFSSLRKVPEFGGALLAAYQTLDSVTSTVGGWDRMSGAQQLESIGNIGMSFLPAFQHKAVDLVGHYVWGKVLNTPGLADVGGIGPRLVEAFPEGPPKLAEPLALGGGRQQHASSGVLYTIGGDPTKDVAAEGGNLSPEDVASLTDQFNAHLENVSAILPNVESTELSLDQRWQDAITAAREFDGAQRLDASLGDPRDARKAALKATSSALQKALDSLIKTGSTDPDCKEPGCDGEIDRDGYCDQCGTNPMVKRPESEMFPEIRSALSNTDAQNALCAEVYAELVQLPGSEYLEGALTSEQFANACIFVPDSLFERLSSRPEPTTVAFVADAPFIVGRESFSAMDFDNYSLIGLDRNLSVLTLSTQKSVWAHEVSHLLTRILNPEFLNWSRGVRDETGFNPEEALAEIYGWDACGLHVGLAPDSGFPYLHTTDNVMAALQPGPTLINWIYQPEAFAAEYLYQRAGRAVYLAQADGDGLALAGISPEEYRVAGRNLVYAARFGADPEAMAVVAPLATGAVTKFFNSCKSKIDAENGDWLPLEFATRVKPSFLRGRPPRMGEDIKGATDQAVAGAAFRRPEPPRPGPDKLSPAMEALIVADFHKWQEAQAANTAAVVPAASAADPEVDPEVAATLEEPVVPTTLHPSASPLGQVAFDTLAGPDKLFPSTVAPATPTLPASAVAPKVIPAALQHPPMWGDTANVASKLSEINGDMTGWDLSGKLFGDKSSDGKQFVATRDSLAAAGYSEDVHDELSTYLQTLSRTAGRATLDDLNSLTPEDHAQIQSLADGLLGDRPGVSNPAEFRAHLLMDLASLSPENRQQILDNGPALAGSPQQWQSLTDFINSSAGGDDAAVNAHQAFFLLSLPTAEDRGAVMDHVTSLVQLQNESATALSAGRDLTDLTERVDILTRSLTRIAVDNQLPVEVVGSFATPAASPLDAAICIMPGVKGLNLLPGSKGAAYDAAGKAIVDKLSLQLEAGAARQEFVGQIGAILKSNNADGTLTNQVNTILEDNLWGTDLYSRLASSLRENRAGPELTKQVQELFDANPEGPGAPQVIRILLDTGALDEDVCAYRRKPGVSGPVATSLTIKSLKTIAALGAKAGVRIKLAVATDPWSKQVLLKALDALGIEDVDIRSPTNPQATEFAFRAVSPDVYISLGRSDLTAQPTSLLDMAINRPETTTFAISDGTELGGAHALNVVDYPMTASTIEVGAQVLVAKIAHQLGSSDQPLWDAPVSKGPLWNAQFRPVLARKAFKAAAKEGLLYDGRFPGVGSSDVAQKVNTFVGIAAVAKRAIDAEIVLPASAPDTWQEQFVRNYTHETAAQSNLAFPDYEKILSRAAPNSISKPWVVAKGFVQRTGGRDQVALLTVGGAAAATHALVVAMIEHRLPAGPNGEYETLLASLGTVPRQLDIIDKTLIGQWETYAKMRGISVEGDQNTSQVNLQRRTFWSDVTRTVTYPVTAVADVYSLVHNDMHNFPLRAAGVAEYVLLPVLGWLEYVYLRKLGNASIDAEGKLSTELTSNLKPAEVKINQFGAYGGFSTASVGLLLGSSPAFTVPYALVVGRSLGNFGQTGTAWWEQLFHKKPEKLDTVATILGSGAIIATQTMGSIGAVEHLAGEALGEANNALTYGHDVISKIVHDLVENPSPNTSIEKHFDPPRH